MMDDLGGDVVQVTKDIASVQVPGWSPDGCWIVFAGSELEGSSQSRLWRIDTRTLETFARR
ncbi:hypothetical protein [Pararhizobium sp. DWP3-4]|uniref:hypothetical protein n=1 Tax=Pararhizobium sp. DWP3-4 TaxID=2804565 RepID=UPI003CED0482